MRHGCRPFKVTCLAAGLLVWSVAVTAQPFQVDLARSEPGSTTRVAVDRGSYTVTFTSLLPARDYHLSIQHNALDIAPIPLAALTSLKAQVKTPESVRADPCSGLQEAGRALGEAVSESEVPALLAAVRRELELGCTDQAVIAAAKALVSRTSATATVDVAHGEEAVVTIQRGGTGAPASWTFTLTGPARGRWVTTYGVSVAKNDDELFFAKAGNANEFTITPQEHVSSARLIPSVYFSWITTAAERRDWSFSPTVGFGATNEAPAVMLGYTATYNRNLGITGGISLLQQKRLAGNYTAGQTVAENLSEDQLHRKVWRPSWIIAATVRFGSNPFAGGETPAPSTAEGRKPADAPDEPPAKSVAEPGAGAVSAPGAAPTTPVPGAEAGAAFSFNNAGYRLFFTESGDLRNDGKQEYDRLLADLQTATDVFVLSHGWWNSTSTADCRYQQIVEGLRARTPAALSAGFKPAFVGIYWPSIIFPDETGDCEPPIRTPQGRESMVQGSFDQELEQWAAEAFPTAADQPGFASDRTRLIALLGRERRGETLTRGEAIELAAILDKWRRAAPATSQATEEGPAGELFSESPTAIVDQWNASSGGRLEASGFSKALNFTNAFTFWTMKERAGIVGSRGVFELVRAMRARGGRGLRIHLIGHSFGGRVVSAAVAGQRGTALNQVDSLVILQGAFSHFAFSTRDQIATFGFRGDKGGLFEAVAAGVQSGNPAVKGRMVAMYSLQDRPNNTLYPLATRLKGSDREAARVLRYGSIGADGFQGPPVKTVRLEGATREQLATALREAKERMVNADATNVVRDHSDLIHDQVFDLIWAAILAGREPQR